MPCVVGVYNFIAHMFNSLFPKHPLRWVVYMTFRNLPPFDVVAKVNINGHPLLFNFEVDVLDNDDHMVFVRIGANDCKACRAYSFEPPFDEDKQGYVELLVKQWFVDHVKPKCCFDEEVSMSNSL